MRLRLCGDACARKQIVVLELLAAAARSMAADFETFERADAGASLTYPVEAGSLKKGDFVCIKDHPCKIIEASTSKMGKHGHAKCIIVALDIFTNRKLEDQCPASHSLPCPVVSREEYQLLDVGADGTLSLMDGDNNVREDLNLPEDDEVTVPIREGFAAGKALMVAVVSAMGKECVVDHKHSKS